MAAIIQPLFTRQQAERLVPGRAFAPAEAFFDRYAEQLAAVTACLPGFAVVELRDNPDNFGLYQFRIDCPVPFLWFGLGWNADDEPGTLPSWGASLEVNREYVSGFRRGDGGLLAACQAAAEASRGRLGVYVFEEHVELAEWRPFEWLLETEDQAASLIDFWSSYLEILAAAGIAETMEAFVGMHAR